MADVTSASAHAQAAPVEKGLLEFYPEHPPREDTARYRATHKLLVDTLDQPCHTCGVRKSTLGDPGHNPHGATQMETHHYPVQREYIDAVDWRKVAADFRQVIDRRGLIMFVDSPANMLVLCSDCHRSPTRGIHHLPTSDWAIGRYLFDGYVLNDTADQQAADIALDNQIVEANVPPDERA